METPGLVVTVRIRVMATDGWFLTVGSGRPDASRPLVRARPAGDGPTSENSQG